MSIITDEVLAAMAAARIKARKDYVVQMAAASAQSLRGEALGLGVSFEDYEGDLLALIEVMAEVKFPQLITESVTRDTYEGTDVTVGVNDEVSNWFASGEANAQVAAYMTPDVIKLDAQAMTPEYGDMGTASETVTLDRRVYEELSRSEASKYAIEKVNRRIAEVHRELNRGDTDAAVSLIREFASRNGFVLSEYVTHDSPEEAPVRTIPEWVVADRLSRALEGILDRPSLETLMSYMLRPYHFEESPHQNSIGIVEVRSGLCNVLNAIQVAERLRDYMHTHWPTSTVDRVVQAALASNNLNPSPEPVSSWPQAGPADEPTILTPIIERDEVDPSTQSPSYYGPMD